MSSSSAVPQTTTNKGPARGRRAAISAPADPNDEAYREIRRRSILTLCDENDPVRVSSIVDALVAAVIATAKPDREYYSVAQLRERWGLSRKSVERLPLAVTRFGGSVRYALTDVLAFETLKRKEKNSHGC